MIVKDEGRSQKISDLPIWGCEIGIKPQGLKLKWLLTNLGQNMSSLREILTSTLKMVNFALNLDGSKDVGGGIGRLVSQVCWA